MTTYKTATSIIAGVFVPLNGKALLRANDKGSCVAEVQTKNPDGTFELTEITLSAGRVVEISFTGIEMLVGSAVALS